MAGLMVIIEAGNALDFDGQEFQQFVKEHEKIEREERASEREFQKLRLEAEKEIPKERIRCELEKSKHFEERHSSAKIPKLPIYKEKIDDIDAFLHRFEIIYAHNIGWKDQEWAACLTHLLTGQALNVLHSPTLEDALDNNKMKEALATQKVSIHRGWVSREV